jgi:hypothetical protein
MSDNMSGVPALQGEAISAFTRLRRSAGTTGIGEG